MGKIFTVALIVVAVIALELIMLVTMPILVDFISSANATMVATSNMSNYPGSQDFMNSTPWILWFIPPVIGMILIVIVLKRP